MTSSILPSSDEALPKNSALHIRSGANDHPERVHIGARALRIEAGLRRPIRLYYGSRDLDVVPAEAIAASRSMRARSVDVEAIDVGAVGHDASMLAAAPLILAWLRELEAGAR